MTRKEQREQSMRIIGYTALDLFFQKGFFETKIADIAEQSKMSVGLIFHYYESKEMILRIIIEQYTKEYISFSNSLETYHFEQPLQYLQKIAETLVMMINGHPHTSKAIYISQYHQDILADAGMKEATSKIFDFVNKHVVLAQQKGQIREGDSTLISYIFLESFIVLAREYGRDTTMQMPEAEWFISMIAKEKSI